MPTRDRRMLLIGLRRHLMRNQSLWVPGGVWSQGCIEARARQTDIPRSQSQTNANPSRPFTFLLQSPSRRSVAMALRSLVGKLRGLSPLRAGASRSTADLEIKRLAELNGTDAAKSILENGRPMGEMAWKDIMGFCRNSALIVAAGASFSELAISGIVENLENWDKAIQGTKLMVEKWKKLKREGKVQSTADLDKLKAEAKIVMSIYEMIDELDKPKRNKAKAKAAALAVSSILDDLDKLEKANGEATGKATIARN